MKSFSEKELGKLFKIKDTDYIHTEITLIIRSKYPLTIFHQQNICDLFKKAIQDRFGLISWITSIKEIT